MNKTYLVHSGIKGQKWGVRRYQNPDGTLTPAGIARYGTYENMERTQSRNRKIAVGVGVGVAVAGGTYLAVKNRKLSKKLGTHEAAQAKRDARNAKSKVTRAANKAKKAAAIASGEAFQLQKGDKILLSRNYGDAQMIASFMKVKGGTIWSAVTGGA